MKKLLIAGLLSLALSACGGSSGIQSQDFGGQGSSGQDGSNQNGDKQNPNSQNSDGQAIPKGVFSNLFEKLLDANVEEFYGYINNFGNLGIAYEDIPLTQELLTGDWVVKVVQRDNLCDLKKPPIFHEYYKNISIAPDGTSSNYDFYPLFNYEKLVFDDSKVYDELFSELYPNQVMGYAHNIPEMTEFYYTEPYDYSDLNLADKISGIPSTLANLNLKYLAYPVYSGNLPGEVSYRLDIVASGDKYYICSSRQNYPQLTPDATEEEILINQQQQQQAQEKAQKYCDQEKLEGKLGPKEKYEYYFNKYVGLHYLVNNEFYMINFGRSHSYCDKGDITYQFDESYYFMKKL